MKFNKYSRIISVPFILSLLLLLVNDLYLKQRYPGALTGKLSDFSGLYIFPFFFAALIQRGIKLIYILTALLFVVWKSPFSEPFISYWNSLPLFYIGRIVDYTDLLALLILPVSYYQFNRGQAIVKKKYKKVLLYPVAATTVFSLCATSEIEPPQYKHELDVNAEVTLRKSKEEVLWSIYYHERGPAMVEFDTGDSLFYFSFLYKDTLVWANIFGKVILNERDTSSSIMTLDSIVAFDYHSIYKTFLPIIYTNGLECDFVNFLDSLNYLRLLTLEKSKYEQAFVEDLPRQVYSLYHSSSLLHKVNFDTSFYGRSFQKKKQGQRLHYRFR